MKGFLVFLSILAAISAAPSPDPQYTISWSHGTSSDRRAGQGTWGTWGSNQDKRQEEWRDGGRREDGWRDGEKKGEEIGKKEGERSEGWRDGGRREDGWRDGGRREDGWKDGEKKGEEIVKKEGERSEGSRGLVLAEDHQRDSRFPWTIGRQGLGYQKRNFRSLAVRFPITPEILQPIGYRDTIKELYYVPLNNYN